VANPLGSDLAAARRAAGLTQAELAERIGTTQAAVARLERGRVEPTVRTMRRLADVLSLVFEVHPGRGLTVRPAVRAPVTLDQLRARREEILRAAAAAGVRNLRVFGLVSRNEAGPGSDIDIVVELEPGRTLMDLGGLQLDLEELLGRPVHVVTLPRRPPSDAGERRVLERIKREAVPL
jgi:predicted nucleotidyltransferase